MCYIDGQKNKYSVVEESNRATTSGGEYSITTEDGRVRPKHVLIESKK
jgi:hypothetical protein